MVSTGLDWGVSVQCAEDLFYHRPHGGLEMALIHLLLPPSWMGNAGLTLRHQPGSVQMRSWKVLVQGHMADQRQNQAGPLAVAATCPVVPSVLHQCNEKKRFVSWCPADLVFLGWSLCDLVS